MAASLPFTPTGRKTALLWKKREGEDGKECLKVD